jgi:hypothetical protein
MAEQQLKPVPKDAEKLAKWLGEAISTESPEGAIDALNKAGAQRELAEEKQMESNRRNLPASARALLKQMERHPEHDEKRATATSDLEAAWSKIAPTLTSLSKNLVDLESALGAPEAASAKVRDISVKVAEDLNGIARRLVSVSDTVIAADFGETLRETLKEAPKNRSGAFESAQSCLETARLSSSLMKPHNEFSGVTTINNLSSVLTEGMTAVSILAPHVEAKGDKGRVLAAQLRETSARFSVLAARASVLENKDE